LEKVESGLAKTNIEKDLLGCFKEAGVVVVIVVVVTIVFIIVAR
jgi:hypothetical protein